tara:strand:- start:3774 stop:4862 length:1089 start_codon:yes stop_codon:yes gene_type:complete
MSDLETRRLEIDQIDQEIQSLISQRAKLAKEIAKIKQESAEEDSSAPFFYRPEREAEVLRAVKKRNDGALPADEMIRIFREIMSACLAAEQKTRVATLGPQGTYTQTAALNHFGHSIDVVPQPSVEDIFRAVEARNADFGVVPVENSGEGMVGTTLDMLVTTPLNVCGEVELRVHHLLLGRGGDIESIGQVLAHSQALGQCRLWLETHMPGVPVIAVSSNAEAARLAAEDQKLAAIAGETAAELYELNTLAANIEDHPENTTRFLVIGETTPEPSGDDKTSLVFATQDRPGALHHQLEILARNSVNMTRIESRPSKRGLWEYLFFIDIEGHQSEELLSRVLSELHTEAAFFKMLGSYPRRVA